MVYQLSATQIQDIERKLPPQLAALRKQYPVTISLLADYYHAPPFPQGYKPKLIEIYFDELADGPGIIYQHERGLTFDFDFYNPNSATFFMDLDHEVAYIRLNSVVLLNRSEGIVLPDILPETNINIPKLEL